MGYISAVSEASVLLAVGDMWKLDVQTTDDDGYPVSAVPTVTVTPSSGGTITPTPQETATGLYRAECVVSLAGRYVARASVVGYGVADFAAYATGTTTNSGMPTTSDVATYLREGAASWMTADLQDALDAEAAAQRATCRVSAVYPADLRQALLRRVQRNLAMRQLPLAVLQGDAESGASILPGRDPEVRRLEAPHRRLVIG